MSSLTQIHLMGVELFHANRETDEHSDMIKRIVYFRNYLTKAPTNK